MRRRSLLLVILELVALVAALFLLLRLYVPPGRGSEPPPGGETVSFVFSEMLQDRVRLWIASSESPEERRTITEVTTQRGYGLRASVSPDGNRIAYVVLPPGAIEPSQEAALWVMGLDGAEARLLAEGVDLRTTPLWSPQGDRLLFKRILRELSGGITTQLFTIRVMEPQEKLLLSDQTSLGLYPFDWSKDGMWVYHSRITTSGTELAAVEVESGRVQVLAHASDGVARDFHLSPDGQRILFAAPEKGERETTYAIVTVSVEGEKREVWRKGANDHYSPIWTPQANAVTYSTEAREGGLRTLSRGDLMEAQVSAAAEGGFEVPISWSPDARYLSARFLRLEPSGQIASEGLVILSPGKGSRREVKASGFVEFVGWVWKGG